MPQTLKFDSRIIKKYWEKNIQHHITPARIIMVNFIILSLSGAFLLMTPWANSSGEWRDFISAFFMAVSACCVTGLAVVDIGTDFTLFGQVVTLALIQIGGLSYMTITTILLYLTGKRLTTKQSQVFEMASSTDKKVNFGAFVLRIGLVTLSIEFLGFLFLLYHSYERQVIDMGAYANFWDTIFPAAFHALFHAVSAFCNAGLSLYSDSMIGFRNIHWVLLTISMLQILGGLGYTVLVELMNWYALRKRKKRFIFSLHSRVSLIYTALLLGLGFIIQFLIIQNNDLPGISDTNWIDQAWVSFFQTAETRSAGFNLVPIEDLGPVSHVFMLIWMFIGACPGGTGGGIKITTLIVLFAIIWAVLRNSQDVKILNRSVNKGDQQKTVVTVAATVFMIFLSSWFVDIFEVGKGMHFVDYIFEVTSAFSTVGLSTGVTSNLSDPSLLILSFCMLVGRPGPLLFLMALVTEYKSKPINYPEEGILIG